MKRTEARRFGDIFNDLIKESGVEQTYNAQRLCYLWAEVVGPTVNSYTVRRWVDGTTLHVHLTSAPLRNELSFQRQTLIEHLNRAVGAQVITDIRFH